MRLHKIVLPVVLIAVHMTSACFNKRKPALEEPSAVEKKAENFLYGTIISKYFGKLPVSEDHPMSNCFQLGFGIQTKEGIFGFVILDYEDSNLRTRLEGLNREINTGDRVRVKPSLVFSLTLDTIIRPEDIQKLGDQI